jgi:stage II sporulation protein D
VVVVRARGGDTLALRLETRTAPRRYRGSVRVLVRGQSLQMINDVALEDYVPSVLASEVEAGWRRETLKAQAVVTRTYTLTRRRAHAAEGFDLCDSTHCQAYRGLAAETPGTAQAAQATAGEVLEWQGELAATPYHSTCGGHTAANDNAFPGALPKPYLRGVRDEENGVALCRASPHFTWGARLSPRAVQAALQAASDTSPGRTLRDVVVLARDPTGRVTRVRIVGSETKEVDAHRFLWVLGRGVGWGKVKSAWFRLRREGAEYIFHGRGLGHGVGLCQWGAEGRARAGWDYRRILEHYFPGTRLVRRAEGERGE